MEGLWFEQLDYPFWIFSATSVLLGVFAIKSRLAHRAANSRVQKQGGSFFLGHLPMEFAYWILTPIGKWATALKISPNFFSWSCFALGIVSGILAGTGNIAWAGVFGIVSALFDALDGIVARARGIASDAGEVLDAAIDRYTEFFFLAGLIVFYRESLYPLLLVMGALLGSFLVSYSQAKAEALNQSVPKGWMRRPERAVYLAGGAFLSPSFSFWLEPTTLPENYLHYPLLFSVALVAVFSNATAILRFVSLYRSLSQQAK